MVGVLLAMPAFAEKPRVVVLDFTASNDKLKRAASSVAEQMLTELSRAKTVEVLGTSDVTALLGMERQRQLLGCTENSSSCLAEITAAMGAPWLVMGNLAQLGKVTRIDIKLIRASDGKAVVREGKNLSDESEIFDFANSVVPLMLEWIGKAAPVVKVEPKPVETQVEPKVEAKTEPKPEPVPSAPPEEVATTQASPAAPVAPWLVVTAGGLVTIAGGITFVMGLVWRSNVITNIQTDTLPLGASRSTYEEASGQLVIANNLMFFGGLAAGVGLAGVAGGLIWRFKGDHGTSTVSIAPGPGSLLVQGAF